VGRNCIRRCILAEYFLLQGVNQLVTGQYMYVCKRMCVCVCVREREREREREGECTCNCAMSLSQVVVEGVSGVVQFFSRVVSSTCVRRFS
jgi:hypothetical protein